VRVVEGLGAVKGRRPADPEKRLSKAAMVPMTDLESSPEAEAPPLPGAKGFLAETRRWYATWASSPQSSQFLATDWQRLHMLARLVDLFFREPSSRMLAEIRLNEAKLGGTPEDRLRLRWRLSEAERDDERVGTSAARSGPVSRSRRDPRLALVEGGKS
jgi:hypothetical protein